MAGKRDNLSAPQPGIPAWQWLACQLYEWLIVIPVMLFSTFFFGTIIILFCFADLSGFSSKVSGTLRARLNEFIRLMNIGGYGKEKLQAGQAYVLVASHLSLLDIYVLYGFSGLDWRPGTAQLRFHDPVLVDQDADLDQLAIDTRSTIVAALNAD